MMEMIDRYVYAVVKRLPTDQRKDVEQELRSLIEDMLEERNKEGNITEEHVNDVLVELGSPGKMAERYRGTKRYVIGPEIYDLFMIVLKISLVSYIAVQTVISFIQMVMTPVEILNIFIDFIVSIVITIPIIIGWVTLAFGIVQHFAPDSLGKIQLEKDWSPASLPLVPDHRRQINRKEAIVGIIFYVLFIIALAFNSEYFGIWIFENDKLAYVISFLNEKTFNSYFILLLIVFGFGIIKESMKFIYEKWTYSLVIFTAIANILSLIFIMFIITGDNLWNPEFMNELVQHNFVKEGSEGYDTVRLLWERLTQWVMLFFAFAFVWDIVAGYIKVRKGK